MNAEQRRQAEQKATWMEAKVSARGAWECVLSFASATDIAALLRAGIAASEDAERLRGTHEIAPNMTTPAVEQVAAWAAGEIERCHAEGAVFDCVFRCVSEGGSAFDIDAEEILELAAMRAHVCTDNSETLKSALADNAKLRALLERAAGALSGLASVTDDMVRTRLVLGRTDTDSRLRDAGFLLAEIEGVGK